MTARPFASLLRRSTATFSGTGFRLPGRTIAITQQEISEMVGMTRESINKQLRAWAGRDLVRLEHGAIVVLNAEALREMAEAGSGHDGE